MMTRSVVVGQEMVKVAELEELVKKLQDEIHRNGKEFNL